MKQISRKRGSGFVIFTLGNWVGVAYSGLISNTVSTIKIYNQMAMS